MLETRQLDYPTSIQFLGRLQECDQWDLELSTKKHQLLATDDAGVQAFTFRLPLVCPTIAKRKARSADNVLLPQLRAESLDDRVSPHEVPAHTIGVPGRRRPRGEVTQVRELVAELDEPGRRGDLAGVLDLQALALGNPERLVIRDFRDDAGDSRRDPTWLSAERVQSSCDLLS